MLYLGWLEQFKQFSVLLGRICQSPKANDNGDDYDDGNDDGANGDGFDNESKQ